MKDWVNIQQVSKFVYEFFDICERFVKYNNDYYAIVKSADQIC